MSAIYDASRGHGAVPGDGAPPGGGAASGNDASRGAALTAEVVVHRGAFALDAAVAVRPGEVVAVLGPNGSGKSTLLGVLAGLVHPDKGTVVLGDRTLTGPGVAIPPERRGVGLMGQDPLLFPHLSALENVAFGPRSHGVVRAAARAGARQWLDRMGLAEFAHRKPARLSGGQRQRVALARALAAEPKLLLLDEPLGALDAQTAPEIRQVLSTHIRAAGVTTLLVTHDVLDAATLADSVIVLVDGAVADAGPTARVLSAPRNAFTAALAGLNMVLGRAASAAAPGGTVELAVNGSIGIYGMAAEALAPQAGAMAVFPPSAVAVYLAEPGLGSPRNVWRAEITALEPGPSSIRVRARLDGSVGAERGVMDMNGGVSIVADLTAAAVAELGLHAGLRVHLAVKATEVRVHAGAPGT